MEFFSQFIKKGDLVFDIGACYGARTRVFLKLGAKVVAVEPSKACLKRLEREFANNKNVSLVPKAVADKKGHAKLSICEEEPAISTMSDKWKNKSRFSKDFKWTKSYQVLVTTLDALIAQHGQPSFCKIDVEGAELHTIKGLTKPSPYLSFEFNKEFLEDANNAMKHLTSLGKVKFNLSLGESMKLLFKRWLSRKILNKKIGLMNDNYLWGDIYAKFDIKS